VRKKSNKGNGTPDDDRGGKSEDEEGSGERDRAGKRRKLGKKGDDSIGGVDVSPVKNTRSSTQGRKENKKCLHIGIQ
jgi:hypothetical protein